MPAAAAAWPHACCCCGCCCCCCYIRRVRAQNRNGWGQYSGKSEDVALPKASDVRAPLASPPLAPTSSSDAAVAAASTGGSKPGGDGGTLDGLASLFTPQVQVQAAGGAVVPPSAPSKPPLVPALSSKGLSFAVPVKPQVTRFTGPPSPGLSPLLVQAVTSGDVSAVTALLDPAVLPAASSVSPLHQCDENKLTLLHHAAKAGKTNMARWLLDKGCSYTVADKNGATPLLIGVVRNHGSVVRCVCAFARGSFGFQSYLLMTRRDCAGCWQRRAHPWMQLISEASPHCTMLR